MLLEALRRPADRAARLRLDARRSTATWRRSRCARTRAPQPVSPVRRDQARRPSISASSTTSTTACRRWRCATSRSTARGSGPTWASTGSSPRRTTASRSRSMATASRPATSPSSATRSRPTCLGGVQGVPGRVYNIGGGSRVSVNEVLRHRRAGRRPAAGHRPAAAAEGRHARHLRRYVAGPHRSGLRASRRRWPKASRPNTPG